MIKVMVLDYDKVVRIQYNSDSELNQILKVLGTLPDIDLSQTLM